MKLTASGTFTQQFWFSGFRQSVASNIQAWKQFYDNTEPQTSPLPAPWEQNLTMFQRMVVIRMIRPDKVRNCVTFMVESGVRVADYFLSK